MPRTMADRGLTSGASKRPPAAESSDESDDSDAGVDNSDDESERAPARIRRRIRRRRIHRSRSGPRRRRGDERRISLAETISRRRRALPRGDGAAGGRRRISRRRRALPRGDGAAGGGRRISRRRRAPRRSELRLGRVSRPRAAGAPRSFRRRRGESDRGVAGTKKNTKRRKTRNMPCRTSRRSRRSCP